MTYYLGIDAGGSHCRSRLVDAQGAVLGMGETGPANARIGMDKLYEVLLEVTRQATDAAGLTDADLASVHAGFGIAGISRPGIRDTIQQLDFPFASEIFETDGVIANLGAHRGCDGATLILGTGSVAQIRVNGIDFAIGGYGFPISDEGSGAALGLSAVRHALRALDGRSARTALGLAVADRFGQSVPKAIEWMDRAVPRDYAAIAPLVMEFAETGDSVARSIVEDAAQHVERFIETIFERGAPRCALVGGIGPRMKNWLRARTVEKLCDPKGDPLDGALQLAGFKHPTAA